MLQLYFIFKRGKAIKNQLKNVNLFMLLSLEMYLAI